MWKPGKIVKNAHEKSVATRRQIRKEHGLGLKRPVPERKRHHLGGGTSIVSMPIRKLTDDEFVLLQKKMELIPPKKQVKIEHDWKRSAVDLFGPELAYAIIELYPDAEKVRKLADPFPDIDKRIKRGNDGED